MGTTTYTIGIDLGGTKIQAGLISDEGIVFAELYEPVDARHADAIIDQMVRMIKQLQSDSSVAAAAVGLGVPATIDRASGSAVVACNLPIMDVPLRGIISEKSGLPTIIDNDATAATIAESRCGAGQHASSMIMLTLGTGIGGGIIINGRVFHGADGAAGEFGHISLDLNGPACRAQNCPNLGCFERYVSGTALAEDAKDFIAENGDSALAANQPSSGVTAEYVVAQAEAGDPDAVDLLNGMGQSLGMGLVTVINIFNPEMIVLGGGFFTGAKQWLLPEASRIVASHALRPGSETTVISQAVLAEKAGMVGAGLMAHDLLSGRDGHQPAAALWMCATPIGNLGDASPRLVATLSKVDVIASEDTRVARRLLSSLDIPAPQLVSVRAENEQAQADALLDLIADGKHVAFISDAGTPGVSDPGMTLVSRAHDRGTPVKVIAGPSAVSAALSVSGLGSGQAYRFAGFVPRSAGDKQSFFADNQAQTLVVLESPHRLLDTLQVIKQVTPKRRVVVARELTKRHEQTLAGTATELIQQLAGKKIRGEITLVLEALPSEQQAATTDEAAALQAVAAMVAGGMKHKVACKVVSMVTGHSARDLYNQSVSVL